MCPALINSVVDPHHIVTTLSDLIINFVWNNILGTHTCLSDPFSFIFVTREVDPDPVDPSLIYLPDTDP
jgi:hypothetical protein